MTSDPESTLFDFAASNRVATNEEEKIVTELHAALGTTGVPLRLRRPPTQAPSRPWRSYMFAAITAALVIAVATAGFFAIREQVATPSPTEIPEVVLGLAGHESTATAEVCGTTGDIPIFSAINESPIDSPSIIVTLEGEMKLVCDGEETLLAEGIRVVTPSNTPHGVVALTQDGPLLMNIATGENLRIPIEQQPGQVQSISTNLWESWAILPSTDDSNLASVYNLETLTEYPIETPDSRVGLDGILATAFSADDNIVAFAVTTSPDEEAQVLEGFFIVSSDGSAGFVEASETIDPRQMAISPDGDTIAVVSFEGQMNHGITSLTLFNTGDGSVVDSWEIGEFDRFIDLAWLNDGSALLYTDGIALYQIPSPGAGREVLFEGDDVRGLILTREDHVIAISHLERPGSGMPHPRTTILNLNTGEGLTLDGHDMWPGSTLSTRRTTLVLGQSQSGIGGDAQGGSFTNVQTGTPGASGDGTSINRVAVDAINGEVLGEINYTDPDSNGFAYSSWGNNHNHEVLAFGPDSMWRLVDENGNSTLEQIPSLPIDPEPEQSALMIMKSPDGYISISTYEPATSWLLPPGEDEWIQVDIAAPDDSQGVHPGIYFLHGENATATSPSAATPEASPITSATCDFSGDTPIVMGADSAQFDGTNVIVTPSGEMKLICGETESTLATGVDFAFPMSAPNTVMAETDSGAILINIATGDSLQLPYSAMVILQDQSLLSTWGSWMVVPSTSDQTQSSLIDLRTLTEIPISASGDRPMLMNAIAGLSVNSTDTHAAVAVSFQHSSSSRYLQGFFIADADGNNQFVQTQPDVLPRSIQLSPDGETIATSWYQGSMESGETNISLYSASNGSLIESWEMPSGDISAELTWLNDGSGLVFTDGSTLYLVDAEHPGDGLQILLEGPDVSGILLTPDPNVMAVSITEQQQQGPATTQTAIVNIETGESLLHDGRDLWASSVGPAPTRSVLMLLDFFGWHGEDSLTLTVVDATSGEVLDEIEHNPAGQVSISNALSERKHGDVNIFAMGPDTIWQLLDEDGQPSVQEISLPAPRESLNSDDILISMDTEGRIALTLMDPFQVWMWIPDGDDGEWNQLDVEMPVNDLGMPITVLFIPGSE